MKLLRTMTPGHDCYGHKNTSTGEEDVLEDDGKDVDTEDDELGTPIDRGWAWVIVIGCFGAVGLAVGTLKSYGVILVELSRKFNVPASLLAGPQSLAGFLHLFLGPVANYLSDRYSHRKVVFLGGVLTSVGIIATSFAPSIEWFYVTYGLISGAGLGLIMCPSLTFQGKHFRKYRALANGLSGSGAGVASFVLPNIIQVMLDHYGLFGALLTLGGLTLNICVCALLFRPQTFWKKKTTVDKTKDDLEYSIKISRPNESTNTLIKQEVFLPETKDILHKELGLLHHENSCASLPCLQNKVQMYSPTITKADSFHLLSQALPTKAIRKHPFIRDNNDLLYMSIESIPSLSAENDQRSTNNTENRNENKNMRNKTFDWSILKNGSFLRIAFAMFTGILVQFVFYNVLPSLLVELKYPVDYGAYMVAILGICETIGRIVSGLIADLSFLERLTVYRTNLALVSILGIVLPSLTSFVGLCIAIGCIGVLAGGYTGIHVAVLADIVGIEKLSASYGFAMLFASVALLINPPLSGLIKDCTGSWIGTIYFGACFSFAGAATLLLPVLYHCFRHKNNKAEKVSNMIL